MYDETTIDVVSAIDYTIPFDKQKYNNWLVLIYPVMGGYEGVSHIINTYAYATEQGGSNIQIKVNLNQTAEKSPVAFQVYKSPETGLLRLHRKDDFSFNERWAINSKITRFRISFGIPEKIKAGTRIVIKGW